MKLRFVPTLVCSMIVSVQVLAAPTTGPAVYATPADVLAAANKAAHDGDAQAMVDTFDANGQAAMASSFLSMIISDLGEPSTTAPVDKGEVAFKAKYGLDHVKRNPGETDDQFGDRIAGQIKDKRQFLIDLDTRMMQDNGKPIKDVPPMVLENLHIDADGITAVGKLVSHQGDGSSMSEDVQFKKIDGSWRFDNALLF